MIPSLDELEIPASLGSSPPEVKNLPRFLFLLILVVVLVPVVVLVEVLVFLVFLVVVEVFVVAHEVAPGAVGLGFSRSGGG